MTYLSANSRAPWFIERGSSLNTELMRLLDENLRRPVQQIAVKIMDKVFVREGDSALTLRLHEPGSPLLDIVIFLAVFAYLYAFYAGVRNYWVNKDNKVKGT